MKKLFLSVVAVMASVGLSVLPLSAETFNVDVTIPTANSANFVVFELVAGQPFPTSPNPTNDLNFDVTLDSNLGVFFGDQFYAIDVAPVGGAGQLDVLIEYTDGLNPNGGINDGLGTRGVVTAVKVNADSSESELAKQVLRDINNTTVLASQLAGGFMRMYIGLVTGDAAAGEPAAAVPFNLGDASGQYTGVITLTATQP